jgi:hypothetical protein
MTSATLSKRAQAEQDKQEAKDYLLALFAGDESPRVGTILRHVSQSGMSRDISLFYKGANITWHVARAMGETIKDKYGQRVIRVGGCGMDMGFHLVYSLSGVLYGFNDRNAYRLSQEWI